MKSWVDLGDAPATDAAVDLTPVDYVSRAVVYLSRSPQSIGKVFHLANPAPVLLSDLTDWIRAFGFPLRRVSYDQWREKLMRRMAGAERDPLSSLAPFFAGSIPERESGCPETTLDCLGNVFSLNYASGLVKVESQSAQEALEGSSISCARVDSNVIYRYFAYFVKCGFLEARQAAEMRD
jgi:thioester reductase-like protein